MAGEDISPIEEQPQPFNATKLEPAKKRRGDSKGAASPSNPYKRQRTPSPQPEVRKQKRPGKRARITDAEQELIRQKQLEREKEQEAAIAKQGIHDAVKEHYNAVPERGREWRKTDSRIKGLRSFNNWIKSTIIQKFSPDEDFTPPVRDREGYKFAEGPTPKGLLVLDLGCGKGGDLGKWQQAPQKVALYVGLDPANVSIDQAKDRYRQMKDRGRGGRGGRGYQNNRQQQDLFHAELYPKDCFGESIADIPIVQEVGFSGSGGPARFDGGGFDVVSMMFCLHYAFESEAKARQMLKNVSGALKKGGRLIGCIPNSAVISEKVRQFNARMAPKPEGDKTAEDGEAEVQVNPDDEREEGEAEETCEWRNDIYRVRFPGPTPADGIFRPPFGQKYNYFLHEAVEEVPEYVVPWGIFRQLAEDYNLEMQYHKGFDEIWEAEKDDPQLGPLSERMGVRERGRGPLLVSDQEMEAASFYVAFCFYKV